MPFAVFMLIALGFAGGTYSNYLWAAAIAIGIGKIAWDSFHKIRRGEISLDYIAFLAMAVAPFAEQYLAGAVVSLMITGGESLDEYASARAESALRSLVESIPKICLVRAPSGGTVEKPIQDVRSGEKIIIKPNELVPLDGTLVSGEALLNEANLTGEAIPVTLRRGAFVKSGCVNVGETLELSVEGSFETSTYMRIVHLVDEAKEHQAPVVKLAEKVNFPFTAIALVLAGGAYLMTHELARALAVLVIATPCPLIIAAPVAFIGGLSRAARKNIIVKRPTTLEVLSRASVAFFDKTGTLTLGEPRLVGIDILVAGRSEEELLAIVGAIEFHSIHPLARAIEKARKARSTAELDAQNVVEHVGTGIEGDVGGSRFRITRSAVAGSGITLSLLERDTEIAQLRFEDVMKENVGELFESLKARGVSMEILTGDKRENADRLFGRFGIPIRAEQSPENEIRRHRRSEKTRRNGRDDRRRAQRCAGPRRGRCRRRVLRYGEQRLYRRRGRRHPRSRRVAHH